ncbi:hypothetical protein [Maribacter polysaccharolyticus]|uniref:hypothetical protein n=1 Tax=Maribacter polysaccharolyticus TaxID=3020831 RepID=UPI00237F62E3|nr:hypothetical protein [Maribacter polysaccharolyticus]MDE3743854.1 hypothetical protein [Maribacter polysaccharolyticus]
MQWINTLKKWLIPCLFLIASHAIVFAHSPTNSSSLLVEGQNGMWMLQIRAALSAFEEEVHARYSQDSYSTPEGFKELMGRILASDVVLSFDGLPPITLKDPQIKLRHETLVVYQFKGPDKLDAVTFKNAVFKSIYRSKNILFVLKNGLDKNRFSLTKDTDFMLNLKVTGSELIPITQADGLKDNSVWLLPSVAVLLMLVLAVVWVKKRQVR